jgi:hypothetical protein
MLRQGSVVQVYGKIDCESIQIQCVSKEIQSFAIDHYSEMFGYINTGRVNIRIHRDIEGKMWFGVGV